MPSTEPRSPPTPPATLTERPVRAVLLNKLCGEDGLFALGAAIARVIELASSEDEGNHSLASYVLADAALTQKILRLANTPAYRTSNGAAVTTVSRAISLLGFDNVKTTALALLLVDTLASSPHADSVRAELEAALCASLFGRELARRSHHPGAEEVAIAALFKNIGALLVASREHPRYVEIGAVLADGIHSTAQASQLILGCSYDTLSAAVLREWKIPDVIVRALSPLAPGPQREPVNRPDWMRQVASFSQDAARLLLAGASPDGSAAVLALEVRYAVALGLQHSQMVALFDGVGTELRQRLHSMGLILAPAPGAAPAPGSAPPAMVDGADGTGAGAAGGLPDVLLLATLGQAGPADACYPSGKPLRARELLQAGLQQLTDHVSLARAAGPLKVNDVILMVLDTLYRSLGFRYATVCLKDAKSGQYRGRVSLGERHAERQAGFAFPLVAALPPGAAGNDLFRLAMANNADLMIADASVPKIAELLPAWHRALLPDARSFIVLPLVLQSAQLGFFYADRVGPAPEGVAADETALIRALKAQVLAALAP